MRVPSRRSSSAVVAAALLCAALPFVHSRPVPVRSAHQAATPLDTAYFALVERYQRGDVSASTTDMLDWKDNDLRSAGERLSQLPIRRYPFGADEVSARFKAAAIMLHTDAGVVAVARGGSGAVHFAMAHRLLTSGLGSGDVRDQTLQSFTLRNWLLAATEVLTSRMEYDIARSLLRASGVGLDYATLLGGTDRDLLLATGSLEEASAFFDSREKASGLIRLTEPAAGESMNATMAQKLNEQQGHEALAIDDARQRAEKLFRRAIEVDASCDEAHLRLGRVLYDRGALQESASHLERVLAESRDATARYLATMFLGGVRENEGHLDVATMLYLRALEIEPRSQTARVALSAVRDRSGQTRAARQTLMAFAERGTPDKDYQDPWWRYPLGQADEGFAGLDRLRTVVADK